MKRISIAEDQFYKDPASFMKEGRKQQAITLVHTSNGCIVCAILTKEQYQELLRQGVV